MKVTNRFVIVLAMAFLTTSAFAMSATEYTKRIVEVKEGIALKAKISKTLSTYDSCNTFSIDSYAENYIQKNSQAALTVINAHIAQTEIGCPPSDTKRIVSVSSHIMIDAGKSSHTLTLFVPTGYQVDLLK